MNAPYRGKYLKARLGRRGRDLATESVVLACPVPVYFLPAAGDLAQGRAPHRARQQVPCPVRRVPQRASV
jgi:hypothetical protein